MTRRTWNETAIEAELLDATAELGRFPKRAELTARGVGGLWNAMQRHGGIEAWRERVSRATSAPAADTSQSSVTVTSEPTVTAIREPTSTPPHAPTAPRERTDTATHEQIATRAYFLAQERGGDPMENWLTAEQELCAA